MSGSPVSRPVCISIDVLYNPSSTFALHATRNRIKIAQNKKRSTNHLQILCKIHAKVLGKYGLISIGIRICICITIRIQYTVSVSVSVHFWNASATATPEFSKGWVEHDAKQRL